jgi:hypothetical protein
LCAKRALALLFSVTGVATGEGTVLGHIRDCTRHLAPGQTLHAPRPAVPCTTAIWITRTWTSRASGAPEIHQDNRSRRVTCFAFSIPGNTPKNTRYLKEQEKRKEEKLAAASRRKQVRMEEESCPGRPCSPLARLPRARLAKTEPGKGWNCFCLAGNGRDRQSGWW